MSQEFCVLSEKVLFMCNCDWPFRGRATQRHILDPSWYYLALLLVSEEPKCSPMVGTKNKRRLSGATSPWATSRAKTNARILKEIRVYRVTGLREPMFQLPVQSQRLQFFSDL